jgi:hypothetical protein
MDTSRAAEHVIPDAEPRDAEPRDRAVPLTAVPKVGALAWSFIGVVIATIIVVTGSRR